MGPSQKPSSTKRTRRLMKTLVGPATLVAYIAYGTFLACRDGQCFEAVRPNTPKQPAAAAPMTAQAACATPLEKAASIRTSGFGQRSGSGRLLNSGRTCCCLTLA